jgi:hypothetical protein
MNKEYGLSADSIKEYLVGRMIVSIDEYHGEMTLDDGTVLELIDAHECCAWYDAVIGDDIKLKTIITDVDEEPDYDSDAVEAYRIVILGEDCRIGTIDVVGDPTSGYYCHSAYFSVRVKKTKPEFVDDVAQDMKNMSESIVRMQDKLYSYRSLFTANGVSDYPSRISQTIERLERASECLDKIVEYLGEEEDWS